MKARFGLSKPFFTIFGELRARHRSKNSENSGTFGTKGGETVEKNERTFRNLFLKTDQDPTSLKILPFLAQEPGPL